MRCYIKHSEECFIMISKHLEVVKKTRPTASFFNTLLGVWITWWNTLPRVWYITSNFAPTQIWSCQRRKLRHKLQMVVLHCATLKKGCLAMILAVATCLATSLRHKLYEKLHSKKKQCIDVRNFNTQNYTKIRFIS